jgi:hypothetical protein
MPAKVQARVDAVVAETERVFGPRPVITTAPIPPSAVEQKAVESYNPGSSERVAANVEAIVRAEKVSSSVEQVEADLAHTKVVQDKYAAALNEVARLKALIALRDQQA